MELWRPTTPKIPNVHFLPDKRAERWDGQGKSGHEERDGKKKKPPKIWAVGIHREQLEDPAGRDTEFQEKGRIPQGILDGILG